MKNKKHKTLSRMVRGNINYKLWCYLLSLSNSLHLLRVVFSNKTILMIPSFRTRLRETSLYEPRIDEKKHFYKKTKIGKKNFRYIFEYISLIYFPSLPIWLQIVLESDIRLKYFIMTFVSSHNKVSNIGDKWKKWKKKNVKWKKSRNLQKGKYQRKHRGSEHVLYRLFITFLLKTSISCYVPLVYLIVMAHRSLPL